MPDREKVIKGLECLADVHDENCVGCGYIGIGIYPVCVREVAKDALAMLKEQEAVEPKTGHWIFESAYCEAWSHTCSECGKRMTTAYNTYANYCWNCGAKMEVR